jgi:hypothetical protein
MQQDFERSVRNLSHALAELKEIANDAKTLLLLPLKFSGRATTNMVTCAIQAFLSINGLLGGICGRFDESSARPPVCDRVAVEGAAVSCF